MRMPGMNGVQFLAQVRQAAPNTVRMMLTGYSDISAAMDAVNEGNIFRFLAKPCEQEILAKAIASGLVQYRLVRSEKDLLENTLMGSIKVLTDVLGAVSPEAFGKSIRITHCVRHLVAKFHIPSHGASRLQPCFRNWAALCWILNSSRVLMWERICRPKIGLGSRLIRMSPEIFWPMSDAWSLLPG
jgi:hypothetical protein